MKRVDTKKINYSMGWMTGEKYMLRELEQQAAKGWIFDSSTKFHVILKQGAAKKMQYAVDLPPIGEEEKVEYLKYFEAAGWYPAYKNYCFYVFYADENVPPLHTDQTFHEKVKNQWLKKMLPHMAIQLALVICFVILGKSPVPSWLQLVCFPLAVISGGLFAIWCYATISLSHIHDNHNYD